MVEHVASAVEEKGPIAKEILNRMVASLPSKASGEVDVFGSLALLFYFLMAGLDATAKHYLSALMLSLIAPHADAAQLLFEAGADVNRRSDGNVQCGEMW
jgi:hypothetical protein